MSARALTLWCLAVTACVTRDTPPPSKLTEGCLLNSDCEAPLVCVFRRCHTSCTERRDCPPDSDCQLAGDPAQLVCTQLNCENGPCPAGQTCGADRRCRHRCTNAADCAPGQTCVQNQCVWSDQLQRDAGFPPPVVGGCEYSSECAPGQRCNRAGQCIAECLTPVDCSNGQPCVSGRCVPFTSGTDAGVVDAGRPPTGCEYTSQCDAGARCSNRGECVPECATTRDCPLTQVCTASGACEPLAIDGGSSADAGCLYSSQCPAGQRCSARGGCEPECREARDCSFGDGCFSGACLPSVGDAGVPDGGLPVGWGAACLVSSQCLSGLVCDARGRCTFECLGSSDCSGTPGRTCCQGNRCQAASFCAVVLADAGARDAGTAGPDAGCVADVDCLDADFCNGSETCRAGRCVPGTSPCFDNNPCTNDLCLGAFRQCTYQTIATDNDGDGHYPTQCPRDAGAPADDCDDNDVTTYGGAPERCDWKDNNCNGSVDEQLWRERAGARGLVSSAPDYIPSAGPPVAVRVGAEVVVVAPSHHARGSHDAFRLDATSFSVITGPVALHSANSPWATCSSGVTRYGNQAVLPSLTVSDAGLALTSLTARFTNPQASCCTNDLRRFEARLTIFGSDLTVRSSTVLQTGTEGGGQCRDFTAIAFSSGSGTGGFTPIGKVAAAYSRALDQHIATWWDTASVGNAIGLRFNTVNDAGVLGLRRDVYSGVSPTQDARAPQTSLADTNQSGPQVAVGNRGVLFAWTNVDQQPLTVQTVRWVIYQSDLSSVRAGPFQFVLPNSAGSTSLWLDSAAFDGQRFMLHVSTTGSTAVQSRFITIDEDGQLVSTSRALGVSTASAVTQEFGWGAATSTGNAIMGSNGFVTATQQQLFFRVSVAGTSPTANLLVTDVDLAQSQSARSDFALVPLTDTSVGVLWTDGHLRKTVVECQP
jgi:hypothetical protein